MLRSRYECLFSMTLLSGVGSVSVRPLLSARPAPNVPHPHLLPRGGEHGAQTLLTRPLQPRVRPVQLQEVSQGYDLPGVRPRAAGAVPARLRVRPGGSADPQHALPRRSLLRGMGFHLSASQLTPSLFCPSEHAESERRFRVYQEAPGFRPGPCTETTQRIPQEVPRLS
jgi:hypothetical protein